MANSKISALPSATTPLAGTEVLPVVQSSTTKQVSVANLTAGRDVSASGLFVDANSATAAVRITQLGAGNALLVEDSANPDATPFVIDASGQVIVGNDSALTYASGVVPQLQVNKAGAEQMGISRFSADTGSNAFVFLKSRGATIGAFDIVASGDGLGSINWYGADGAAGIQAASISAAVDGTPGTSDMPGRLVFSTTADGASSPTERLRIANTGNITFTTGNIVQGTAAKGVDFTANTPKAGMTSQLLNWYEEGTYTPSQGGGLTVVGAFGSSGRYTRIGRQVTVIGTLTGATSIAFAAAGGILTGSLPFNLATYGGGQAFNGALSVGIILAGDGGSSIYGAGTIAANARISFQFTYFV